MRPRLLLLLPVLLLATATGCSLNATNMVKELAKSKRSWCLAGSGYGVNIKVGGSGTGEGAGAEGDMSCGDGGLSLKSSQAMPQLGVPIMLSPQLSIGQPTLVPPPTRPTPAPRAVPQAAPGRSDDVTLTPIAWHPAPQPAAAPLSAETRLLLYSIGDLHGLRALQ